MIIHFYAVIYILKVYPWLKLAFSPGQEGEYSAAALQKL